MNFATISKNGSKKKPRSAQAMYDRMKWNKVEPLRVKRKADVENNAVDVAVYEADLKSVV